MSKRELKRYNLPLDQKVEISIDAKPYELIVGFVIGGVILSWNNKVFYGGGLIILSLCIFMILPNRVVMELYHDYFVLYNKINRNDCVMINYSDVVYWTYKRSAFEDEVIFKLNDGSIERCKAFSKSVFERNINLYMSDKKYKKQ